MRVSQDEDYRAEWIYTTQGQPIQSLARGPCPCHGHREMAVPSHQILLDLATSPSSPYREKDAAQAAGARWGRTTKSWFYTADMDSPGFDQWKVREPEAGRRAPFAHVAPFNQIFDVAGTRGWRPAPPADIPSPAACFARMVRGDAVLVWLEIHLGCRGHNHGEIGFAFLSEYQVR